MKVRALNKYNSKVHIARQQSNLHFHYYLTKIILQHGSQHLQGKRQKTH